MRNFVGMLSTCVMTAVIVVSASAQSTAGRHCGFRSPLDQSQNALCQSLTAAGEFVRNGYEVTPQVRKFLSPGFRGDLKFSKIHEPNSAFFSTVLQYKLVQYRRVHGKTYYVYEVVFALEWNGKDGSGDTWQQGDFAHSATVSIYGSRLYDGRHFATNDNVDFGVVA